MPSLEKCGVSPSSEQTTFSLNRSKATVAASVSTNLGSQSCYLKQYRALFSAKQKEIIVMNKETGFTGIQVSETVGHKIILYKENPACCILSLRDTFMAQPLTLQINHHHTPSPCSFLCVMSSEEA